MMAPVGAALLGAGIFAKDVYKRNFKARESEVELKAVWSRSIDSAQAFTNEFFPSSKAVAGEEGLQAIIDDESIQLVVVVLPVQASLQVVERCLAAGKAVVQEKPVAGSVAEAVRAISAYRQAVNAAPSPAQAPLWMFAENYRYEAVFSAAARRIPDLGKVIKLDLLADLPMDENNRYFGSAWRRDVSGCPGGFFMDSAVHFVAALRMLATAAGLGEAATASAHAVQAKPDLSFPDSLVGMALFGGGVPASISISLAAHQVKWSLSVVGTAGSLEVSRGGWGGSRGRYMLSFNQKDPRVGDEVHEVKPEGAPSFYQVGFPFCGCDDEFQEFVGLTAELRNGSSTGGSIGVAGAGEGRAGVAAAAAAVPDAAARSSPEEGARDLALIEALLASAAAGGQPVPVTRV